MIGREKLHRSLSITSTLKSLRISMDEYSQEPPEKIVSSTLLIDTSHVIANTHHRCSHCNKLLGVEQLLIPALDIKCARCGSMNTILREYDRQVIISDKNGIILYVNEQVSTVTGYSPEELIGRTPAIWGGQMTKEFYQKMWDQIAVHKKSIAVKTINRHKNGKLYPTILRIAPILDIHSEVELFIGMETVTDESLSEI